MPESIIRSEQDHNKETIEQSELSTNLEEKPREEPVFETPTLIIWTPGFIIRFVLTLVIGLSAASLLTQGVVTGYYPAEWPELLYTVITFACWLGVFLSARSLWVRLGSALSIIWALFMGLNYCITLLFPATQTYTILAHTLAAKNVSLLGSYLCLSLAYTLFRRSDNWFFRIAPIVAALGILIVYYFAQLHPLLRGLENAITEIALVLSLGIWWFRPSCWRVQPGPTLLLGLIPLLQLFFSMTHNYTGGEPVFFTLVVLLLSTLTAIRILQREQQG